MTHTVDRDRTGNASRGDETRTLEARARDALRLAIAVEYAEKLPETLNLVEVCDLLDADISEVIALDERGEIVTEKGERGWVFRPADNIPFLARDALLVLRADRDTFSHLERLLM